MSGSFSDKVTKVLGDMKNAPPEGIQSLIQDTYPRITLKDVRRIQDGLIALLEAKTKAEQRQREREYIALHAELRKTYKESGRP